MDSPSRSTHGLTLEIDPTDSLSRSTPWTHSQDRPHGPTLEIDSTDSLSKSTSWTHPRDRPHGLTLEIDLMDSPSRSISWIQPRYRPHGLTLKIDLMDSPSRSTSWTHPRDRPHALTLEIDPMDSLCVHQLRVESKSSAVKGLWAFWPACCAPAARAGYLSFRAPGAKTSPRDQLRILKISFKNILQHTLIIYLQLESSKPLQTNAVKGLWAFGPACCAPAARAGYVSSRTPGAFSRRENPIR
jgi:hypothetical protein